MATVARFHPVTRISLAALSRLFNWRDEPVVVRPETMICWHRAGWRLYRRVLDNAAASAAVDAELRSMRGGRLSINGFLRSRTGMSPR